MGYYVAKDKGYYDEVGLSVDIVSGGGDISETTAVNNGTVDFGVTWVSNTIAANAGGMNLVEDVYKRQPQEVMRPTPAGMNISGMISMRKLPASRTFASGMMPVMSAISISTSP